MRFNNVITCEKYATCGFLQNMRSDHLKNYSGKLRSLPPPSERVLIRLCVSACLRKHGETTLGLGNFGME